MTDIRLAPADPPSAVPTRSRGVIALLEENCTVCMLCVRDCPDWCIEIEAHQEVTSAEGGRRRTRNVLDAFRIDYGLCLYCGICVEVCPFDALFWSPAFAYAAAEPAGLVHDRRRLRGWLGSVPPPEALVGDPPPPGP